MKRKLIIPFALIASVTLFFSCKKDYNQRVAQFTTDASNSAFIKVIDATVGASRNYIYQDATTTPLTGAAISVAGFFPATATYALVPAGSRTIIVKDTLSTSTQKSVSAATTLSAGSYYTIFTYDTTTNAKYVVVPDDIQVPSDSTVRVRFANMIFSSSAIPNVDVYSARAGANIFTNVPVGQVTNFISMPASFVGRVIDTLYVRATGTTTTLAQNNTFVPTAQRSYTFVFEGRYQTAPTSTANTTPTAATPTRSLVLYTNR